MNQPISEIKAKHPMPWAWTMHGNNVIVRDLAGVEVPLFTMLEFVTQQTALMARPAAHTGV